MTEIQTYTEAELLDSRLCSPGWRQPGSLSYTQDIGTAKAPFRSVGSLQQSVPYYDQLPGEPHPEITTISTPDTCIEDTTDE